MKIAEVLKLIEQVPDYLTFMTVDELNESARALAVRHPKIVKWFPIGKSRAGDEICALKIGNGPKKALLFAMPHPNEPIGSMMLEFLSARLAEDADLRDQLGYTWYIVKCIDVDGTRLNEGWFKGPFSVTNYARHYYRPPGFQQVEWTFPVDYKTLHFDKPMPETKALMSLVEEIKPDFMYSLHNSGFGGVYLYISKNLKQFYPDFYQLVKSQELPLHLGEPEVPYVEKFSDAIFGEIGVEAAYDFLEKNTGKDPAGIINMGAGSYEYARRYCDPLFLVCEMPYFYNPSIHDTSPTSDVRRDVILQGVNETKERISFAHQQFDNVKELLSLESPFKVTIFEMLKYYEEDLAAHENWAKNDPSLTVPATVAEKFDSLLGHRFYHLLSIGTFLRMVEAQIQATGSHPALDSALHKVDEVFHQESTFLERELAYSVIPIKKLVSVQLGCALLLSEIAAR